MTTLTSSPFQGLRTTIYKVSDVSKAKDWYSGVLGIEPYFDEPFYVGYNVGGYELGLHPDNGESAPGKAQGAVAYWGVEDVHAMYEKLVQAGATAMEDPFDAGGGIVVAAVKDPWGNAFGIICNPHFKAE